MAPAVAMTVEAANAGTWFTQALELRAPPAVRPVGWLHETLVIGRVVRLGLREIQRNRKRLVEAEARRPDGAVTGGAVRRVVRRVAGEARFLSSRQQHDDMASFMALFRAYFWFLVVAAAVGTAYAVNEYLLVTRVLDPRWLAVGGFGALLVVFFFAFQRSAPRTRE